MKTLEQFEQEHNKVLNELSERIIMNIRRVGGLKNAVNKTKLTAMMLNYSVNTDSFKTKIKILKKLEAVK